MEMEFDYNEFYFYLKLFFFPLMAFIIGLLLWAIVTQESRKILPNTAIPLGREKEINRLADNILSGQSSALVGIFDEERTEVLNVLKDNQQFDALYGAKAASLIFSYVDISTFEDGMTPKDFWERVLMPLSEIELTQELYDKCAENDYKEYYLSRLIEQLATENLRLVILLNRFDYLLKITNIKKDFFATLRSLSSSSINRSFVTVLSMGITTNQFLQLNTGKGTTGSSLVSYIDAHEIVLGSIQKNELLKLLKKQELYASMSEDKLNEIISLTGGFPYLLKFVENYLQENQVKLATDPNKVIQEIKGLLKIEVNSLLKNLFIQNGEFVTLERAIADYENSGDTQKELKKLGIFKENDKFNLPIKTHNE